MDELESDGKLLAITSFSGVYIYDKASGEIVKKFENLHTDILSVGLF